MLIFLGALDTGVIVRVSIVAMKHHDQDASCGGKGLLGSYISIAVQY